MTIVNDASTINVIDEASLALASIVNYDRKWRYNLEHHLLTTLGVSITIVTHFIIQATGVFVVKANNKVTDNIKDTSSIHYEIYYGQKKFHNIGPMVAVQVLNNLLCKIMYAWWNLKKIGLNSATDFHWKLC